MTAAWARIGLTSSTQTLLETVGDRVTPTSRERDQMERLSLLLKDDVRNILEQADFQAEVSVQGSVAKDTWLRGEADLDIFAKFSADLDRAMWNGKVLPALREGLKRYPIQERYAEHPYLEFTVGKVRVNVVPCYAVEQGKWKSATDRTPFHTEYMRRHLTPVLKSEVRLLKKFLKGIGGYGAEIRVGGFSGMLVETLTLRYGSFIRTLEEASNWSNRTTIKLETSGLGKANSGKFGSPLLVIDPVDPNRNLAAAVREERLWEFVAVGRQFLARPELSYFFPCQPRPRTRTQLREQLKHLGGDLVVVLFPHSHIILDILWGQLYSLEKALVGLAQRHEFRVLRSGVWGDEDGISAILLAVENATLPLSQLHMGPPVMRKGESEAFLTRHLGASDTISGPRIGGDRWMVEKRRAFPNLDMLLVAAAKNDKLGLAVPAQLESGFRRQLRVLQNEDSLSLYSRPGFARTLAAFLDGKPDWLRPRNE